jgi:hypothetical protein
MWSPFFKVTWSAAAGKTKKSDRNIASKKELRMGASKCEYISVKRAAWFCKYGWRLECDLSIERALTSVESPH